MQSIPYFPSQLYTTTTDDDDDEFAECTQKTKPELLSPLLILLTRGKVAITCIE